MATHDRTPTDSGPDAWDGDAGRYSDDDVQGGLDAIDKHNQRLSALHTDEDEDDDMYVSEAELQQCLQEFSDRISNVDDLPDFAEDVNKALNALQDRITAGDMSRWEMQDHVASLQQAVRQTYHDGRNNRKTVAKLAWMVDRLGKALLGLARRQTPTNPALPLAQLTKALTPGLSHAEQVRAAAILKSWFGARGGQPIAYNRELCAKLRLCKAISPAEEARWYKWNRLPDDIDLAHPAPRASVEQERQASVMTQAALAGFNPSPLAAGFGHLAKRR